MCVLEIVDTYEDFKDYWEKARDLPVGEKIKKWRSDYMGIYPELLDKQIEDYEDHSVSWQEVARNRIFPSLGDRVRTMDLARKSLVEVSRRTYRRAQTFFETQVESIAVIYVGIGCGAGWATQYRDKPALLFGLENIAECGWEDEKATEGLVAHESSHLLHDGIRTAAGQSTGSGPFWRLYREGLAKWGEFNILKRESWYEARGLNEKGWLEWCRENVGWLAREFLDAVERKESVARFFGSWYDLKGWKQTGYYLGFRAVELLVERREMTERQLVMMEDPSRAMKQSLEALASGA